MLVLVGLFGTGWVFDLYDLLKSEGASASPVTAPDVTLPSEVTVTLPAELGPELAITRV